MGHLLDAAGAAVRRQGLVYVAKEGAKLVGQRAWDHGLGAPLHALPWLPRTLAFDGATYRYLQHAYNFAWKNERTVEVPLAQRVLEAHTGQRVLEVGNVLSHYGAVGHDVLDKYEAAPGVRNEDVVDFRPKEPYDLVVSVSTLEHVGWDEHPREPGKVGRAVANLRDHGLAPGGLLWVTMPLGWNPEADAIAFAPAPFTTRQYLLRVTRLNRWREAKAEEVRGARYDAPFPCANAVFVGALRKPV